MKNECERQAMCSNDCLEGQLQELIYDTFIAPVQDKCKTCTVRCYVRELNNCFDKLSGDTLALYGCGQAAENLVGLLDSKHLNKIKYYSDRRALEAPIVFNGKDVISPNQLLNMNPDKVILCSEIYAEDMKKYLSELGFDKSKLMNLDYHIIKPLSRDFVNNICPHYIAQAKTAICGNIKTVDLLHDMNNAYEVSNYCPDQSIKEHTLVNIIFGLLSIRDIVNVKKRINEYVQEFDKLTQAFTRFVTKLDAMIDDAAHKVSRRKNDAIIIYLVDAMPALLVDHIPYLSEMKKESICFQNSYTSYCWTTCGFQTILSGKDLLKDEIYNIQHFSSAESPFLKAIEDGGYEFTYLSTVRPNLFDKKYLSRWGQHQCLPTLFWQTLNDMSYIDKKTCYFVHIIDLHDNVSPSGMKRRPEAAQLLYSGCWIWQSLEMFRTLSYINEQFSFFDPLLSRVSTRIVMSDHGNDFDRYTYLFERDIDMENRDYTATALFVNSPQLCEKGSICTGLFGYQNFYKLMEWILGKRELNTVFSDYLRIYALPYYGSHLLNLLGKITHIPALGIVTQKGVYWFDYNGNETYYPNGCSENMINNSEYKSDIEYARSVCGKDFHGVLENPKFALAKEFLLKYGKINEIKQ